MSIYQHFRKAEQPFAERIIELTETVSVRHQSKLIDFLDPRQQYIAQSVVGGEHDVQLYLFGGYEDAERKRALIVPDYVQPENDQFNLTLLTIEYSPTFSKKLKHRDVLGSILGLGLKREKFGDVILTDDGQQVLVTNNIAEYVQLQLRQIGKTSVTCSATEWSQLLTPEEKWNFRSTTVSSFRLDALLADILRLSRAKTAQLIKLGRVKVNWKVEDQPSVTLEEGDHLSVKGYGRFLFAEFEKETKKNKYRVQVAKKE